MTEETERIGILFCFLCSLLFTFFYFLSVFHSVFDPWLSFGRGRRPRQDLVCVITHVHVPKLRLGTGPSKLCFMPARGVAPMRGGESREAELSRRAGIPKQSLGTSAMDEVALFAATLPTSCVAGTLHA